MICKCGNQMNEDAKFCINCGAAVVTENKKAFCVNCGNQITEGAKFCVNCGTAVNVGDVGQNSKDYTDIRNAILDAIDNPDGWAGINVGDFFVQFRVVNNRLLLLTGSNEEEVSGIGNVDAELKQLGFTIEDDSSVMLNIKRRI